jgi:NADH dehydrogenase
LSVPGHPEIFVLGDLADVVDENGKALPGLATMAIQQGRYVAKTIFKRLERKKSAPYKYKNRGRMAFIGLSNAVVDAGVFQFSGFLGWLFWVFVHIYFLIGFENKVLTHVQWAWNYFTRKRGSRLILEVCPLAKSNKQKTLNKQY